LTFGERAWHPQQIDWWNPGSIMLRQGPGPDERAGAKLVLGVSQQPLCVFARYAGAVAVRAPTAGVSVRVFASGYKAYESQLAVWTTPTAGGYVETLIATWRTLAILTCGPPQCRSYCHYWTVHPAKTASWCFRPDIYQKGCQTAESARTNL